MLPGDVRARLDLALYSELEHRVPLGAYQKFFLTMIKNFFDTVELDLAPYLGTPPGLTLIRGRASVIDLIRSKLSEVPK